MATAILVVFRESLEAALVVAIVLGYLARTGQNRLRPMAWIGVAAGIGASAAGALLVRRAAEGFEGRAEQLFEAATMLAGAALILTLVLWVGRKGGSPAALEARVASRVDGAARRGGSAGWGLLLLVAVSILREGIETVLFLASADRGGVLARRTHDLGSRLWVRPLGLPFSHPQPTAGQTHGLRNADGQPLPASLDGVPAPQGLLSAEEQAARKAAMAGLCAGCHSRALVQGHFLWLDSAVRNAAMPDWASRLSEASACGARKTASGLSPRCASTMGSMVNCG